jgi:hypothetical protein
MAKILQQKLFRWEDVERSPEIQRLRGVLNVLPDEELLQTLEEERKGRRDDYPLRAVWNSILAGIVYQHVSIESLRRELLRNGELREVCGFEVAKGARAVPSKDAYSGFLKKLDRHRETIQRMFDLLVGELQKELPELGKSVAVDSKHLHTYAQGKKDPTQSADPEAEWGVKKYRGKQEDGSPWEKTVSWFGYKVHLMVDTTYELPLGYTVTPANRADVNELLPLVEQAQQKHFGRKIQILCADKAYDSQAHIEELYESHGIIPVIDICNHWKDGDETKLIDPTRADNLVYDYQGTVYCHCPISKERREMAFGGFEKDRECLTYLCPVKPYSKRCKGFALCSRETQGRKVRIPLQIDRRIFVPVARSSYQWKRFYKRRTAVERVNSRLDVSFGFEQHFIRGEARMTLRIGLALVVMLSMAFARIQANQRELLRSLLRPAA